ncbi:4263_t:CDS:2 [Gigaspora rosea]|nr:4263_t:CDS:2 [Gigaspora rosea]
MAGYKLERRKPKELGAWRTNNYESVKHTVISIVISSLALVFGIFLYITERINFGEEIKNIISTSVIGAGGSLTLYGSLASLKNLFKEVNENEEEIKSTMEIFKDLYQKSEPQLESKTIEVFVEELEEYYKDLKKIFLFLEGLNKHMHHMLICRSITVTITSLVVLMLAIVSIFYLIVDSQNDFFETIDILLICFSAIILYHTICVMICIQLIIPHITEHMLQKRKKKEKEKMVKMALEEVLVQDEKMKKEAAEEVPIKDEQLKFGQYKSKVSLRKLIKVLYKNFKGEKVCFKLSEEKVEFKRINIGDAEFEGINRVLYGLPLKGLEDQINK